MNLEKGAKVPAAMAIGGRGRANITGFLSARRNYGRTLPPLLRQGGGKEIRWDGRAPVGNVAKNIQAQRDGSLAEFVAAKQHPTNLRSQFPPTLATNEADNFHQRPVTTDPAAGDNMRDGFAPKTSGDSLSSEKIATSDALALQKGMNVTRAMMFKNMSPTDKASYLLRQYYARTAEAAPKQGNKTPAKR